MGYAWLPSVCIGPITCPMPGEEGPLPASRGARQDGRTAQPSLAVREGSVALDCDGKAIGIVTFALIGRAAISPAWWRVWAAPGARSSAG
jgi:hypothetical protein